MKTTYYQVKVTCTGKGYGKDSKYTIFDQLNKQFATLGEVRDYITETYGNCKRQKIHRDNPDGQPYESGILFCFNNGDMSHLPVQKWRQQDWVEIIRTTETILIPSVIQV